MTTSRTAVRVSWTVVDQGLSAASNFLLAVLVARAVDAEAFGAFSVAFLVYSIAVAVNRALIGQPLQITFAAEGPRQFRSAVRSALGATILLGVAGGAVAAVAGSLMAGPIGQALVALGVVLPGLMLQDICRLAFFAGARPARATAIDALWTVVLLAGLLLAPTADAGVWLPILIWGASGLLSAGLGLVLLDSWPRLRGSVRWAVAQRRLTGYLLAEYLLGQGLAQWGILMVGIWGTAAGVGALRAAQVLLGPLNILGAAAFMFAVPEVARRIGRPAGLSSSARRRFALAVSGALGGAAALYGAVLLLLPTSWGEALLGATWTGARSVLLPICLLTVAAAAATGPVAVLYGMGRPKITLAVNLVRAPMLIVGLTVAIPLWDATGAAWVLALVEVVLLPVWFLRLNRELTRPAVAPVTTGTPAVLTTAAGVTAGGDNQC